MVELKRRILRPREEYAVILAQQKLHTPLDFPKIKTE